jgi:hypothetical protein
LELVKRCRIQNISRLIGELSGGRVEDVASRIVYFLAVFIYFPERVSPGRPGFLFLRAEALRFAHNSPVGCPNEPWFALTPLVDWEINAIEKRNLLTESDLHQLSGPFLSAASNIRQLG